MKKKLEKFICYKILGEGKGYFMYERTIAYIDYYENDERIKNVGFLKWESDGKNHKLRMKVSGLYKTDTKIVDLVDEESKILTQMSLCEGKGEIVKEYKGEIIGDDKIRLCDISCLFLKISSQRCCVVRWNRKNISKISSTNIKKKEGVEKELFKEDIVTEELYRPEDTRIENAKENNTEKNMEEKFEEKKVDNQTIHINPRLYEDKWKQICHTYQVVHPFKGETDYVYIKPDDFVIFREPYQKLVNNSFLIHGYYNYHHMILGKIIKNGKSVYYLGVPGVYYEREKMAAEVFGFEGFESVEQDIGNGTFGYYLRRVEL